MGLSVLVSVLMKWLGWLLGLVAPSNAFPQPLNRTEEAKVIARLQKGDLDARNTLIEHNLRLVAHIVKKFDNTAEDPEDLISIGTYGLIKAISTFDANKGTRLATYAARCIENEILMHLRATKRVRTEMSLHDPIGTDREGNEINLIDVLEASSDVDIVDQIALEIDKKTLASMVKTLEPKERGIIEMRYGLGGREPKTQREIAAMLGISRSYVSRIEKRAVLRLSVMMRRADDMQSIR